jgi:hypothetical protein
MDLGVVVGSLSIARFTFTVPLRVFQFSMSVTNSDGSSSRSSCCRNVIFGWIAVITSGARSSSPPSNTTPVTRPSRVVIFLTPAFTRTSAPKNFALASHASATAPMPPSMKPQLATSPSPISPTEWCMSTYAVPGASGPAQVPMIPLTAMNPFICGVSNQRSSRSVALIVNSRVMSAAVCSSTCVRRPHANWNTSFRSPNFFEPMWGGVCMRSGPMMSAIRPTHA